MVKVKITAGTNTIEHDLNRDQSLILSLETICLALSIPDNAAEYVLQNTSNNHYLTQQVRGSRQDYLIYHLYTNFSISLLHPILFSYNSTQKGYREPFLIAIN